MPPLRVPERYQRGLAAIMRLSEDDVDSLRDVLDRTASDSARYLPSEIASQFDRESPEVANEIVTTILSLYSLRLDVEISVDELVSDITDAMEELVPEALDPSDFDRPVFINRLTKLMNIGSLSRDLKITEVTSDHERVFCASRILTDVRPVFEIDHDDKLADARVTHTLKIEYHERGVTKVIYMSISDEGIDDLQVTLDRASAKAATLEKLLKKWSVSDAD